MIHFVTSRDNVPFLVESDERTVQLDQRYAALRYAAELEAHGDFRRVKSIGPLQAMKRRLKPEPRS